MSVKLLARAVAIVAALGFLAGAVIGLAGFGSLLVLQPVHVDSARTIATLFGIAALVGGAMGAVLGPLVAFVLLPRVPLGRAVAVTALGALLGMVVGAFLRTNYLVTAVAGFLLASVVLRLTSRGRAAAAAPPRDRTGA